MIGDVSRAWLRLIAEDHNERVALAAGVLLEHRQDRWPSECLCGTSFLSAHGLLAHQAAQIVTALDAEEGTQ